jgi:hypothetical protein
MCHVLGRRRVHVTGICGLHPQPVSLPNIPHVRILLRSSLLPHVRIMPFAKILINRERHAHAEAGAQDHKKYDEARVDLVAHVVPLLQRHVVDLWDMHCP